MTTPRIIATAATVTALAAAGVAGAAEAPVVSKQSFIAGHAPVTIPGTGIQKGEWMGGRAKLVFRDVTLEGDQQVKVTLRADNGRKIRALALRQGTPLSVQPINRNYAGKTSVTVRVRVAPGAVGEVGGRIYALTR